MYFANFWTYFGKFLYASGQFFNDINGQIFKKLSSHLVTLGGGTSSRCVYLAKFHQVGNIWKVLGNCLRVYLLFGKMLNSIWKFSMFLGAFSIWQMGKYWKNNIDIWSHGIGTTSPPSSWRPSGRPPGSSSPVSSSLESLQSFRGSAEPLTSTHEVKAT